MRNVSVVLVRTEQPGNIGAARRALTNMGGGRLILVDPRCPVDNAAYALAAEARDDLDQVVTYASWSEFYASEGAGVRLALTRRGGRARRLVPLKERVARVTEPLYLIFGPEADGLDNEDLALVNDCCYLPTYSDRASLNLAQAVLLATYLTREDEPARAPAETIQPAREFFFPDQLIKDWLTAMGFDVNARKRSAFLTLRRLFMQNRPTAHEVRVLEAILRQNVRKLVGLAAKESRHD